MNHIDAGSKPQSPAAFVTALGVFYQRILEHVCLKAVLALL